MADHAEGNPLVLQLLLENASVRTRIQDDVLRLNQAQIDELPAGLDASLVELWEQLERETRDVLAIAALQGRRFVRSLVDQSGLRLANDARQMIDRASSGFGWIRLVEDELFEFVEPHNFQLAAAHLENQFLPGDLMAGACQVE